MKDRLTFGQIFDRAGVAAICLIGWYVGNKFERAADALSELKSDRAVHAVVHKNQDDWNVKTDKRIERLEEKVFRR